MGRTSVEDITAEFAPQFHYLKDLAGELRTSYFQFAVHSSLALTQIITLCTTV